MTYRALLCSASCHAVCHLLFLVLSWSFISSFSIEFLKPAKKLHRILQARQIKVTNNVQHFSFYLIRLCIQTEKVHARKSKVSACTNVRTHVTYAELARKSHRCTQAKFTCACVQFACTQSGFDLIK